MAEAVFLIRPVSAAVAIVLIPDATATSEPLIVLAASISSVLPSAFGAFVVPDAFSCLRARQTAFLWLYFFAVAVAGSADAATVAGVSIPAAAVTDTTFTGLDRPVALASSLTMGLSAFIIGVRNGHVHLAEDPCEYMCMGWGAGVGYDSSDNRD